MSKARLTTVVGSLTLLVLVLLGWFLALSPQMSEADDIQAQIEVTDTQNATLRTQITKIQQQEADLPQQRAFADALAARFPATAAQAAMFAQIRTAASQAGIAESNLTALTPSVPQGGTAGGTTGGPVTLPGTAAKGIASLQVGMNVTGTYTQMTKFLATLETMPRAYLIDSLTLGPGGDAKSGYTMTITGSMFALQAPVDPADAASAPPAASPAPGAPPQVTPPGAAPVDPAPSPSVSRVPGAPNVPDPGSEPAPVTTN